MVGPTHSASTSAAARTRRPKQACSWQDLSGGCANDLQEKDDERVAALHSKHFQSNRKSRYDVPQIPLAKDRRAGRMPMKDLVKQYLDQGLSRRQLVSRLSAF